ncbi:MAG: PadR family transcriptional regulator [Blastocatellia bacterium]
MSKENKAGKQSRVDLLQGTLDMMILRTLLLCPLHGHNIAHYIKQTSEDVLKVDHGSLYPALQRLGRRGWVTAEWGTSENNRRARYYSLTRAGKKQLLEETSKWERLNAAIARIMKPAGEES